MALQSDIATKAVNVESISSPRMQLRPEKVFGIGLPGGPDKLISISSRVFDGELGAARSTLHTLT